ncbi:MAG: hypothetical protein M9932_11680 [Xanthobacteraceae bacterium]|nr:hypothetical protein [Xanthobacteraceae bacterium]
MISLEWLRDRLCDALRWQLAHPGRTDGPEIPPAGRRVWGIFLALNAGRCGGMNGPNPISAVEMEAWSRLHREPIRPFELDILHALDRAMLSAAAPKTTRPAQRPIPDEPPTADAILAVFRKAAG